MKAPKTAAIDRFRAWIVARGGEVLLPTNEYELVRFRDNGATSIIYMRKRSGSLTFTGTAGAAWKAFESGNDSYRMAARAPGGGYSGERRSVLVRTLLDRDGPYCFLCGEEFTDDLPPTREHLVPRTAGGPDNLANQFLACEPCNRKVGHGSAAEKIRFRDHKRRGAGAALLFDLRPFISSYPATGETAATVAKLLARLHAVINPTRKEYFDAGENDA